MYVEIKQYKALALPQNPRPNSIFWILDTVTIPGEVKVQGYITDINGIPIPLIDLNSGGGTGNVNSVTGTGVTGTLTDPVVDIATFLSNQINNLLEISIEDGKLFVKPLTSPDNSIEVNSTINELQLKVSQNLQDLINSAAQPGSNISIFNNDIGYITIADIPTKTSDLINDGENGIDPFITIQDVPFASTGKYIIYGGALWTGTGLNYAVSEIAFNYYGVEGIAAPTNLVLNPGDPTNPRFDLIVVNSDGIIEVIQGIPSPNPAVPEVGENQIAIQPVLINPAATTPVVTQEFVYQNNDGWNRVYYDNPGTPTASGTVDFTYTINPFEGIYSIRANVNKNRGIRFTKASGSIDLSFYTSLTFYFRLNVPLPAGAKLLSSVWNNGSTVGNTINLSTFGVSSTNVSGWYQVTVPTSAYNASVINRIHFRMDAYTGTAEYFLDNIIFSSGAIIPTTPNNLTVQKNGVTIAARPKVNFLDGNNISFTVTDDIPNSRVNIKADVTIPAFDPSNYDLEEFNNAGLDPYAHISDITPGTTNLGYIPSPNDGQLTSSSGSSAIIPLEDNTNAGLAAPGTNNLAANSVQPGDNISVLNNDSGYITLASIPDTKTEFNTQLTDGDFLYVGDIIQYTDEQAQDAIGNILIDSSTISFTYIDGVPSITASVINDSITETQLGNAIPISTFVNDAGYITSLLGILTPTITNGDTTHAPTGDAVFDALALKISQGGDSFGTGMIIGTDDAQTVVIKSAGSTRMTFSTTNTQIHTTLSGVTANNFIMSFGSNTVAAMFSRNIANAVDVLNIQNSNATSTGNITNFSSNIGGTTAVRAGVRKDGTVFGSNAVASNDFITLAQKTFNINDSTGVLQFPVTTDIRFEGFSFDSVNKKIIATALLPNVAFVNLTTGNDTTGVFGSALFPFLTLQRALDVMPTTIGAITIYIIGTGTAFVTKQLIANVPLNVIAATNATISFANFNTGLYGDSILTGVGEDSLNTMFSFETRGTIQMGNATNTMYFAKTQRPILRLKATTVNVTANSTFGVVQNMDFQITTLNISSTLGFIINTRRGDQSGLRDTVAISAVNVTVASSVIIGGTLSNPSVFSDYYIGSITATTYSDNSSILSGSALSTRQTLKIGNISAPAQPNQGGLLGGFSVVELVGTSYNLTGCLNAPILSGGGDLSGCQFLSTGAAITLRNGYYKVNQIIRHVNNSTSNTLTLENATVTLISTAYNNQAGAAFDYTGSNVIFIRGLCKLINAASSGTINFFGGNSTNKTNLGVYIDGELQTDRVNMYGGIGSIIVTNTKTSILPVNNLNLSANRTLTLADYGSSRALVIYADATTAGFTITYPPAASLLGYVTKVIKTDATANGVVNDGNGAELINGATTYTLNIQYQNTQIESNGTQLYITN